MVNLPKVDAPAEHSRRDDEARSVFRALLMRHGLIAILDANVLYPAALRSL
jgi:hypothetical protein